MADSQCAPSMSAAAGLAHKGESKSKKSYATLDINNIYKVRIALYITDYSKNQVNHILITI